MLCLERWLRVPLGKADRWSYCGSRGMIGESNHSSLGHTVINVVPGPASVCQSEARPIHSRIKVLPRLPR